MGDPRDDAPRGHVASHRSSSSGGNGDATTTKRPPLAPPSTTHTGRKRSRSNERRSDDTATESESAPAISYTPLDSRTPRSGGGGGDTGGNLMAATPPASASTPLPPTPSPLPAREPVVYADMMLSDSLWEREIAEFGRQLDEMLSRVTDRKLVAQTAQYMRAYPRHSLRFQIKIKQRALNESPRQSQVKLMLFYLFHEFLKLFQGEELRQIQREWFLTIDDVLHSCMRDMKNNQDSRKRIFKTIARWEELGIYVQKVKQWKALSTGEVKPRRAMIRLPRTEAERLAEAPDQLQQFPPPPLNQPLIQVNRTNYPLVFERDVAEFRTALDRKQHWRYSAIAFIDGLAQSLGISPDITLTAAMYFHRVFDRGIYARERYKVAAACLFLSAKASSKRMKLLRMVRTMHELLETPLLAGDEELLELERMQLLYYEIEVLQGIEFELSVDLPVGYLRETLAQMPEKFRQDVQPGAESVLQELFWLPSCLTIRARFLAEAAAYISCRNKDRIFSFSWCREGDDGAVLTEKAAKEILKEYRLLQEWKASQQRRFKELIEAAPRGTELAEVFRAQRGGLRIDVSSLQAESEFTKREVNESRDVLPTYVARHPPSSKSRVKEEESRSGRSEYRSGDRDRDRDYYSRHSDRDRERDSYRDRERDSYRGRERDRERVKEERPKEEPRSSRSSYKSSRDDSDRSRERDVKREQSSSSHHHHSTSTSTSSSGTRHRSDRDSSDYKRRDYDRDRDSDRYRRRDEKTTTTTRSSKSRSRRSRSRSPSDRSYRRRHQRSSSRSPSHSKSREKTTREKDREDYYNEKLRRREREYRRSPSATRDRCTVKRESSHDAQVKEDKDRTSSQ